MNSLLVEVQVLRLGDVTPVQAHDIALGNSFLVVTTLDDAGDFCLDILHSPEDGIWQTKPLFQQYSIHRIDELAVGNSVAIKGVFTCKDGGTSLIDGWQGRLPGDAMKHPNELGYTMPVVPVEDLLS
jgi:hypothetical protein